jgi:DNA-binding NtrC family response regulator
VILGTDEPIRRELSDAIAGRTRTPSLIPALQPPANGAVAQTVLAGAGGSLPPPAPPPAAPNGPLPLNGSLKDIGRQAAREAERELIFRTLQHTRWNRRAAAEMLGISYKALLYKIKEAELDRAS